MSKEKKEFVPKSRVYPLRVPNDLHAGVRKIGSKQRLSDAAVMRMAIERGLPVLEKMFGIAA